MVIFATTYIIHFIHLCLFYDNTIIIGILFSKVKSKQIVFYHNTKCLIIQTFDGNLLCNVDDELYQLVELEQTQEYSKNFDIE